MEPVRRQGTAPRILVVDDDPTVREVLAEALGDGGYEVWTAASGRCALERIARDGLPHLALLDLRMPGFGGEELARRLRHWSDLPIIVISGVADRRTLVEAIEAFAEDYLVKPFDPEELLARVGRVLRRFGDFRYTLGPRLAIGDDLVIDFARQRLEAGGRSDSLTPTEVKILHVLLAQGGRVVSTAFLIQRLWPVGGGSDDVLRVHVHRLRQKLGPRARHYLRTHRGRGYSLAAPVATAAVGEPPKRR